MKIVINSIHFDVDETAFLDGRNLIIENGSNVIVNYTVPVTERGTMKGEHMFEYNDYASMTLEEVKQQIEDYISERLS
ncbi:hypothetical protein NSR02_07140 [Bacillus sp. FSL W8-1122]